MNHVYPENILRTKIVSLLSNVSILRVGVVTHMSSLKVGSSDGSPDWLYASDT